uniref:inositol oxygenase isoform X1 n=1 Tax=Myxine glutinosa TaxID=7769 RepID=UPI00358F27BB
MLVNELHLSKMSDASYIIRPEATSSKMDQKTEYRNYEDGLQTERVCKTYHQMHTFQTVDYVKKKREEFSPFSRARMTLMEAVGLLDKLVDESDPDIDIPNSFHGYQTADAIREVYPHQALDWFHLVGLLHDLGKVLALWGEPQWSVVGDTFPVGCFPQKSVIYHSTSFEENPDIKDPRYNTLYGMYAPCCGLDNVLLSWGHDEYLYQVLKFNGCTIPLEGMYMVRFHSFYPWHTGGDYDHLCNEQDRRMLPWVKEFSKFDLYTKCEDLPDISTMRPYYESLVAKYCPGVLCW